MREKGNGRRKISGGKAIKIIMEGVKKKCREADEKTRRDKVKTDAKAGIREMWKKRKAAHTTIKSSMEIVNKIKKQLKVKNREHVFHMCV